MRKSALLAVLAGAAVVLVGVLVWWWPFLTAERTFVASIPQPAPLFSQALIPLRASAPVCFFPAVIDTRSERAAFGVHTGQGRGEPLRVTMSGPGYRFAAQVKGGYSGDGAVTVPVPRPAHDLAVRVCIENRGRRGVALLGANDRTRTPMTVTAGARPVDANPQLAFYEARPSTLAGHLPIALRRMAVFRPGLLGPWLFWPLAVICVLGLPAGALWALRRAILDDADPQPATPTPADVAVPTPEPAWDPASTT
jgi:hypothetical protein